MLVSFLAGPQKATNLNREPSSQRLAQAVEWFQPFWDAGSTHLQEQHNSECAACHWKRVS